MATLEVLARILSLRFQKMKPWMALNGKLPEMKIKDIG